MTRNNGTQLAKNILKDQIIGQNKLKSGNNPISVASYAINRSGISQDQQKKFLNSICFTEAPLPEIHCFFDIGARTMNFEPYGLVFFKDKLKRQGVSPVFYLNNYQDDKSTILQQFCDCITTNTAAAEQILPLLGIMGKMIMPRGGTRPHDEDISFDWEREWRYPYAKGDLSIKHEDTFIGLCPHNEINEFEEHFEDVFNQKVIFIDPMRNIRYYSDKINREIRRRGLSLGQIF